MTDHTTLNLGTGGDVIATDDIAGVKHQMVKLEYGVLDSATLVSTTNPLPVDQTNTSVADGGALPAKGVQVGGTDGTLFQVLSTDAAGRLNTNINGTVPVSGPLTDAQLRATTVPVSGTVTASGPLTDAQLRATAVPVSGPLTDTQLRAVAVPVSGTVTASGPLTDAQLRATAVPVSGTVTASGPLTDAQLRASAVPVDTELPAAAALADAAANPTAPAVGSFPLLWNGTTWDRAKGTTANGLAVDVTRVQGTVTVAGTVTASGPLTDAQLRATAVPTSLATLPALVAGSALVGQVNVSPQTANGLTTFHLVSAATTNATNLKASAGQVYGWFIYNSNAAARKVAFHNTAGTPTAGASVAFAIVIPPSSAANVEFTNGIAFATGIAITTVTDLTDAGATAVALNDLVINIFFK